MPIRFARGGAPVAPSDRLRLGGSRISPQSTNLAIFWSRKRRRPPTRNPQAPSASATFPTDGGSQSDAEERPAAPVDKESQRLQELYPYLVPNPRRGVIGNSRYARRLRNQVVEAARDKTRYPPPPPPVAKVHDDFPPTSQAMPISHLEAPYQCIRHQRFSPLAGSRSVCGYPRNSLAICRLV